MCSKVERGKCSCTFFTFCVKFVFRFFFFYVCGLFFCHSLENEKIETREEQEEQEEKKKGENDVSPSSFLSSSSWERKYRLPVLAKILIRNPPKKIERHFPKVFRKKTHAHAHTNGAQTLLLLLLLRLTERERD